MGLEPTTSSLHDKGTTTRAKVEPEVVGRGSGSYPVEAAALLSGRGQISTDRRGRKYSNASYSSMGGVKSFSLRD